MAPITARRRAKLPATSFALPGRRYPIDTRARAANALARVQQFGSRTERSAVERKVCRRYPDFPTCEDK